MRDNRITPDFGWDAPKRTQKPCSSPEFANPRYHRVAIMKVEHFGSEGDRDPGGLPGWTTKLVCNGCGREFENPYFHADKKPAIKRAKCLDLTEVEI